MAQTAKTDGRVGPGFYAEYPNNSTKQAFFLFGFYSTVFQAKVLAVSEVAKNLFLEKMLNQSIVVLVDSQAAIKALIKCTVTSITEFNCIRNLDQLGKQNHISIAWIPGHAGVHGNEQRWSRGHRARGIGQGKGHKKKSEAKDSLSEDRPSRGQEQECSRPRPRTKDTAASVLRKKKVFKKVFQAISNL